MQIQKAARQFLPEDLVITEFGVLAPYFQELLNREINTLNDFDHWLKDRSELDAVLEEDLAWRYIRMSISTQDESLREAYTNFVTQIQPELDLMDIESPIEEDQTIQPQIINDRAAEKAANLQKSVGGAISTYASQEDIKTY